MDDGGVYTLLSYLPGADGETAVETMTDEEAYSLGVEAGKCLKKLHAVEIPPQEKTWWERYLLKMPRKIAALQVCEYKLPMQEKILKYYKDHHELMKDRPLVFCHGDYHLGNMMNDFVGCYLGVISSRPGHQQRPAEHAHQQCNGCLVHFRQTLQGYAQIADYEYDDDTQG